MRLKKEKEAASMETDNLFMRYIMQFGAEELPPRMQMPIEQQTDEFYNELLERLWRSTFHVTKGAYMGKNGITRDRTGKPWYYRNSKR